MTAHPVDLPVTDLQALLWRRQQTNPADAGTLALAFDVEGPTNLPCFRQAAEAVVRRHGALRTTFPGIGQARFQRVSVEPVVDLVELDSSSEAEHEQRVKDALDVPIDLVNGPLVRMTWVSRTPTRHSLVMVVHHSVVDYVSFATIMHELSALYVAIKDGYAANLPEAPAYEKLITPLTAYRDSKAFHTDADYWNAELQSAGPSLGLLEGSAEVSQSVELEGFRADAETSRTLSDYARHQRTRTSALVLAIYTRRLFQQSVNEALTVGVSFDIRDGSSRGVVGFASTMLPIVVNRRYAASLETMTRHASDKLKAAHRHRRYGLLHMLVDQGLDHADHTAVYQTSFHYYGSSVGPGVGPLVAGGVDEAMSFPGLRMRAREPLGPHRSLLDFVLSVTTTPDKGLSFSVKRKGGRSLKAVCGGFKKDIEVPPVI